MAGGMIDVIQMCGVCKSELGTFSVKHDNLMLSSRSSIWCPNCQTSTPEIRELAGRLDSIRREVSSLPKASTP